MTHTGFKEPTNQKGHHYLVDTATRHGMSGGPVFVYKTGIIDDENIPWDVALKTGEYVIGDGHRFLGIYTSRPLADSAGTLAQLGLVFDRSEIERAIADGVPWPPAPSPCDSMRAHSYLAAGEGEAQLAVLLALFSTMSISAGEFFAAGVTKRTRAHEVTSSMFASGVILTAVVALLWPGEPTNRDLLLGGFSGAANGTAVLLLYLAYSRGSLRSAAPAAAVVMSSVPIGWDVIVSGTSPSFVTWIGIILGVGAIALTTYERGEGQNDRPILMIAVTAGAIFGVMLILLGEIGEDAGGRPILFQRFVGFVVAVSATRATGPRVFPEDKAVRARSFVVGLFGTSAVVLFVLALQAGGSLAVVSVIGSQYAAVAVLLGVVFGGQTMRWWQGVGLVGTSLAVALITIG